MLSSRIDHTLSPKSFLLPLNSFSSLSKQNIDPPYVAPHSIIFCIQLGEHVVHPGVDVCGNLIQRLDLILLTLEHLLHHNVEVFQLILRNTRNWNNLLVALRLLVDLILILRHELVLCLAENEGFTLKVLRETLLIVLHIPCSTSVANLLLIVPFLLRFGSNLLSVLDLLSRCFLHEEHLHVVVLKQLINLSCQLVYLLGVKTVDFR
ncbi:hypothetical protein Bca4012_083861 [Brassica carinata]